jgi:hypothetical protein
MEKADDEIPMFARFVERGLALPASDFFKDLLGYYGVEYLNLNPNGIFHTAVFVHFCEAFLGIKPRWILFQKFFRVKPQLSASNPRVVGGAGIQMREDAAEQYLVYKLIDSNADWKARWLMARDTLGFEYIGDNDTSRMPGGEVDADDIIDRLARIFKDMPPYTACPVREYSAARPPKKVSSRSP